MLTKRLKVWPRIAGELQLQDVANELCALNICTTIPMRAARQDDGNHDVGCHRNGMLLRVSCSCGMELDKQWKTEQNGAATCS